MSPKAAVKKLIRSVVRVVEAERRGAEAEGRAVARNRANVDIVLAAHLAPSNALDGLSDPVRYVEFLRGCLERRREEAKVVKGGDAGRDLAGRRFDQLLFGLRQGRSMIPLAQAASIGRAMDELAARCDAHEGWALDVGLYTVVSSSFCDKGTLLWATVRVGRCRRALEIGTAHGLGSLLILGAMGELGDNGRLTTIELSEPTAAIGAELIRRHHGDRAECRVGSSREVIPELLAAGATFDLVFHDGGHSRDDYLEDFAAMEPGLLPGAIVVFDDIRWDVPEFTGGVPSRCYEGWQEVVTHPRVARAVELCDGQVGMLLMG